ncbi:hypothetical protein KIN20_023085 [Parelaphostrongylus tenuis]|uniref:FERM domain-containing protein n=1 Tax=Parelaphostrongylus tenuis TaxID=148309 RepID=A0AAD5MWC5_PARTN|nr:hypothetical protein KIN20_023085 [Parelaphostrongylus tenuis]
MTECIHGPHNESYWPPMHEPSAARGQVQYQINDLEVMEVLVSAVGLEIQALKTRAVVSTLEMNDGWNRTDRRGDSDFSSFSDELLTAGDVIFQLPCIVCGCGYLLFSIIYVANWHIKWGLFPFFTRGSGHVIHAKVTTMDADLDRIVIEASWTGRHLFDAVCRIIGLREVWFFGLQFTNKKGLPCWLQMDREIRKQDVPRGEDGCMQFLFLVKFYPEDVEEELIQDLTRHLFFLQIKQAILSMDLYCSPEASVLLASFAVQAINGDCTDDIGPLDLDKLLPKSVIDQYDMSADMWRERIKAMVDQ